MDNSRAFFVKNISRNVSLQLRKCIYAAPDLDKGKKQTRQEYLGQNSSIFPKKKIVRKKFITTITVTARLHCYESANRIVWTRACIFVFHIAK